ncbi:hypothetical protein GYH30_051499 [Glycine max]|uniref:DUF4378 domain-containing protein n=2 Tax=Glycine soja TaxID=3848 RepID=A0A0B2QBI0_GLYSO|nr:uncharacterized protein LOC114395761 [Glycine soja]XP_028213408.1 uncharacterized protein LOC114395761 [Glycine soja]KAH1156724.1 hypothetical protein GYH30_051499 [Glycine max]KHN17304.1 hypothetical protein glysoja_036909 [Glycine soja]RZB54283.1 hypothetical protein D0Y65_049949 [Glycine soja]RZB54284.1 hypothetical protein D0Y65_049949 [Glycine soja]RZB54286.1 hypothetical protein D0Y65_049949 [Glycine soja]
MNDSTVKNLAITEKKVQQHKPGGCVGIFFQLIDWKRKLSKKKLFSKKLLPPAGAKKFKGDEKMPNSKLHLIANENSGGFPGAKKGGNHGLDVEQKSEMRVPSLVARLMGLESIPAAQRDKSKKALCADGKKESLGDHCELDRQGVDLEMGVVKHDSRPQKLQKTGSYERRAVTRFGAEALQIKSVLSRARKYNHHHHQKLASLRTPRIPSGKSASRSSRLIGAATKILEPGLQSRSRAKNSLTYPASMYPPKTGIVTNGVEDGSAIMQNQSCFETSSCKQLMGQTSCKNCGNLLDVLDCKLEVGRQSLVPPPIVSDVITATSMVSLEKKGKSFPPHGHERDVVLPRSQEKLISLVTEGKGKNNAQQSWSEPTARRMPMPHDGPAKWNSSCQPSRALEDDASSFALKHKTQTQEQMLSSERYSSGSTTSDMQVKRVSSSMSAVNGTKDFVAMNRSLSGRSRIRSLTKADGSKFDLEKKPYNRQQSSLSHVRTLERKRRIPNVTQLEGTGSVYSVGTKQRNLHSGGMGGKIRDFNASSLNNSIVKNKQDGQGERVIKVNDNKINDVVSFTFNSSLKQKIEIPGKREETSSDNESMVYFQRPSPLRVDALGAFLEQKLMELTSQRDEELATGAPPKKSSAMILQELISALSSEHLICHDGHHMFNENVCFHYGAKQERLLGTCCNGNHLSPGSVLEASFSSSSLDESSGHGFHPDPMNYSYYGQPEHDTELSDSATSFNKGRMDEILSDVVNQIPRALESLLTFGTELTRSKLNHMKDILLNSELVLRIATDRREDQGPQLLIYQFLVDDLDSMVSDAMWTDANGIVGCEDSKQRKELKGFLLDCVIEYLESNCCQYFNSGFKKWTKLPLCMEAEMLAQEVKREINKWLSMVGMVPDEIIEWEMSHSLGKWTDFDIEAFEAGVDIDGDILQILVDEVVQDLQVASRGTIYF